MLELGVNTHRVTSHHLLALLSRKPAGLILEVTDGTRECNDSNHRVSTFYDPVKNAPLRMAFTLVHELRPHGGGGEPGPAALGNGARELRGR